MHKRNAARHSGLAIAENWQRQMPFDFMGRAFIRRMVHATRSQCWTMTVGLPKFPETPGQVELQKKHGTPTEFAEACVNALGEISVLEAKKAIDKYLKEWKAA